MKRLKAEQWKCLLKSGPKLIKLVHVFCNLLLTISVLQLHFWQIIIFAKVLCLIFGKWQKLCYFSSLETRITSITTDISILLIVIKVIVSIVFDHINHYLLSDRQFGSEKSTQRLTQYWEFKNLFCQKLRRNRKFA
jgi:hypothetical protein